MDDRLSFGIIVVSVDGAEPEYSVCDALWDYGRSIGGMLATADGLVAVDLARCLARLDRGVLSLLVDFDLIG